MPNVDIIRHDIVNNSSITRHYVINNISLGQGIGKMIRHIDSSTGYWGKKIANALSHSTINIMNKFYEMLNWPYTTKYKNSHTRSITFTPTTACISLPDSFKDVKFAEFIIDKGTIKTSTFQHKDYPIVRIKLSNNTIYDVIIEENPDLTINRIGTTFNLDSKELLISYPVATNNRYVIKLAKYNPENGEKSGIDLEITKEHLDECVLSDRCDHDHSHIPKNLNEYYITEKSGAITHHKNFSIATVELEHIGGYKTCTLQVMLSDNGTILEIGNIYNNKYANYIKNSDHLNIIDGKSLNSKDDTQSIFAINYSESIGQARFIKSLIHHKSINYNSKIVTHLEGACKEQMYTYCGPQGTYRRFCLNDNGETLQAHHMTNIQSTNIVIAWSVDNNITVYTFNSESEIEFYKKHGNPCFNIKTQQDNLFSIDRASSVTNIHVSYDKSENIYICASDESNTLHCQKGIISVNTSVYPITSSFLKVREVKTIQGITPQIFAETSIEDLYNRDESLEIHTPTTAPSINIKGDNIAHKITIFHSKNDTISVGMAPSTRESENASSSTAPTSHSVPLMLTVGATSSIVSVLLLAGAYICCKRLTNTPRRLCNMDYGPNTLEYHEPSSSIFYLKNSNDDEMNTAFL